MGHIDGVPPQPEPFDSFQRPLGDPGSWAPLANYGIEETSLAPEVRIGGREVILRPSCGTCVHWDPHPSNTYGTCGRVTDGSDGAWIEAELHEDWAYKAEPAEFNTDASFGCTLWEAKPDA